MAEAAHKILVVDDDRGVRTSLERALIFEGYVVDTASDGVKALDQLDESISAMVASSLVQVKLLPVK